MREETGLAALEAELVPLGVHAYLRGKDLALFAWLPAAPPDPQALICTSHFALPNGSLLPEFDRFAWFEWDEALSRVGKNMARVLASVAGELARGASG